MSWLFSQALVEAYTAQNYLGTASSAQLKKTSTLPQYYYSGKTTAPLSRFLSGTTFAALTGVNGPDVLMWYLAAFPAPILQSATQKPRESRVKRVAFGQKCGALLAKYCPATSSWKTAQRLLFADSDECLVTFPKWGTMQRGACWERDTLAHPTDAIDSGCWLATPTATANQLAPSMLKKHPGCRRWIPTPTVMAARLNHDEPLEAYQKRVQDYYNGKSKGKPGPSTGVYLRSQRPGFKLSPMFCAWLMGWPIGSTGLQHLATDRCQQWLQQHGDYFTPSCRR